MTKRIFSRRLWKTFLIRGYILHTLVSASPVFAQTLTDRIPNPIAAKSFPCLVKALSEAAITIVVPIAIVAIIFAGLKFIIAGAQGNEGGIKQARTMLFWIIIGTAVVVGSFVLAEAAISFFGATAGPLAC
ncbi:MAG: hypothetical protein A3J10_04365 [Candidatus Sungbacteria bacterium RIFCSPLOWO2_02_FULL_54_10]|nr:MAG: hypothetical protein A2679_00850 [Candidatus Sungbacteria bacterium RIFCSPHIGHO2_01_FULL_54_26]OHA03838.1 MAG: hypothetical protein A3C92_04040 [Candidatus Sungbacteria bacterium RIFCSPHIGHO2_02_FULL_53_17]OHA13232.1 MAG: hypothetical protein A3J10_04365 [Candidatus Sungbacteria bacterium RIFCSPLOWO2_02_FULL_54_10]